MRAAQIAMMTLLCAVLPAALAGGTGRRLVADQAADWHVPEEVAKELVGVWKMEPKDAVIFFPGLAFSAFEKAGDKATAADIWAAATNTATAEAEIKDEAEAHPGGPDIKSPDMEIVIVGSNVTAGMWGGMVVFRVQNRIIGVQPMYGFLSATPFGGIDLRGTDGTPYITVNLFYRPGSKEMDVHVNNMKKSDTKDDVNTAYLAKSVFTKDEGATDQALKDIAAWYAASKKKAGADN